jgi:hypothetical protein
MWGETAADIEVIWVRGKAEYFSKEDWTSNPKCSPSGKSRAIPAPFSKVATIFSNAAFVRRVSATCCSNSSIRNQHSTRRAKVLRSTPMNGNLQSQSACLKGAGMRHRQYATPDFT